MCGPMRLTMWFSYNGSSKGIICLPSLLQLSILMHSHWLFPLTGKAPTVSKKSICSHHIICTWKVENERIFLRWILQLRWRCWWNWLYEPPKNLTGKPIAITIMCSYMIQYDSTVHCSAANKSWSSYFGTFGYTCYNSTLESWLWHEQQLWKKIHHGSAGSLGRLLF